ncbi:transposase [Pseudomonas cavernicola]|uniref:Transposase n=1 Tax=Pseudomonas cavernicola TaxID=2320866 RepID=A0A418XCF9_9PSED|nr:transposase [Pseudomonas cavernicola]RJG10186.1 transposase [Pseudomonas cavernicola]
MQAYRRSYRRLCEPGGTYFFTLTLENRRLDILSRHIEALRHAIQREKQQHPFCMLAWVVLPDHLHMLWRLQPGDTDYSNRIRRIKAHFSRQLPPCEQTSSSRRNKQERGIWQRRFWEHLIRDEEDLRRHLDYVHYNPVKHGYVERAVDWPHSSFHHFVERGLYPRDWGGQVE